MFLCGVVEGFYNRPWSHDQRVDLYKKMNDYGLNAYLYAPKVRLLSLQTGLLTFFDFRTTTNIGLFGASITTTANANRCAR